MRKAPTQEWRKNLSSLSIFIGTAPSSGHLRVEKCRFSRVCSPLRTQILLFHPCPKIIAIFDAFYTLTLAMDNTRIMLYDNWNLHEELDTDSLLDGRGRHGYLHSRGFINELIEDDRYLMHVMSRSQDRPRARKTKIRCVLRTSKISRPRRSPVAIIVAVNVVVVVVVASLVLSTDDAPAYILNGAFVSCQVQHSYCTIMTMIQKSCKQTEEDRDSSIPINQPPRSIRVAALH